jgi:hypothetical protein
MAIPGGSIWSIAVAAAFGAAADPGGVINGLLRLGARAEGGGSLSEPDSACTPDVLTPGDLVVMTEAGVTPR